MTPDRIVVVALVNRRGAVLLRMRDERSVVRSNRWSLPGGGAEAGETPELAAVRIVREQTSLKVEPTKLRLAWNGLIHELSAVAYLFAVATPATDQDIPIDGVPGEIARYNGFVTTFVPGDEVQNGRTFTPVSGYVISTFMGSPLYRELAGPRY